MPHRIFSVIQELEQLAVISGDPEVRGRLERAVKTLTDVKTPSTSQAPANYMLPVDLPALSNPPSDDGGIGEAALFPPPASA